MNRSENDLKQEFQTHVRAALGPSEASKTLEEALEKSLNKVEPAPTKKLNINETAELLNKIRTDIGTDLRGDDASTWY